MFLAPAYPNEVAKLNDSVKRKNSFRHDKITPALITVINMKFHIQSQSLSTGTFPESLKIAKVIQYINRRAETFLIIIDQYQYYQPFPIYFR